MIENKPIQIYVPFLGESLNVYQRAHWTMYNDHKKAMQDAVMVGRGLQRFRYRSAIEIELTPLLNPARKKFDCTNYGMALKMIEDALVKLKVIPDDSGQWVHSIKINRPKQSPTKINEGYFVDLIPVDAEAAPQVLDQAGFEFAEEAARPF